jgi:hypothetical protein
MDKFQPAVPVPQGVQYGQVEALKVSFDVAWMAVDLAASRDVALDVRSEVYGAFWRRLKARLEAGEPIGMPYDPFRRNRGPSPLQPVTLIFPPAPAVPFVRP